MTTSEAIQQAMDEDRSWFPSNGDAVVLMTPIHVLTALNGVLNYYEHARVPFDFAFSLARLRLESYDALVRTGAIEAIPEREEEIAHVLVELNPHLKRDGRELARELLNYAESRRAIATVH